MKTRELFFAGALLLSAAASAHAEDKSSIILFQEDFNKPTEMTLDYPPEKGMPLRKFNPHMLAWGNRGGRIAVSYADGYGTDRSGGLYCAVLSPAESVGYMALTLESLVLPVSSPDLVGGYLRGVRVEFAISVPKDKTLDVIIQPVSVPDDYKALVPSRQLRIGRITGTGEYTKYSFKLGDSMLPNSDPLNRFYQDCLAAGMSEVAFNVVWHMPGGQWIKDEGFLFDDVNVSIVR